MSLKQYGIYVAWSPLIDLRSEGLGRQLASFLKGAAEHPDVRFVVACPSWCRETLAQLFEAEGVPSEHFELLSPRSLPLLLRVYLARLKARDRKKPPGRLTRLIRRIRRALDRRRMAIERRIASTRHVLTMIGAILALSMALLALGLLKIILGPRHLLRWARLKTRNVRFLARVRAFFLGSLSGSSRGSIARRFYGHLEETEADLLISMINCRSDVTAWYCPTAFWPEFNRIKVSRLMCVPDVVVADFPVGFEREAGPPMFEKFKKIQSAISGATNLVTYSDHVKWNTLVRRFRSPPKAVHVVRHGSHGLLDVIKIADTADDDVATTTFCHDVFREVLRAQTSEYANSFDNETVGFLFYPTQFRPSKNLITLLRAYDHLLRARYFGLKLVLTGYEHGLSEVSEFIKDRALSHDVLCLHGLTVKQLAACYRLARLAVNPSLSEGGFPFTFTEALSVGTPIVMARIPVTEEVITNPDLQSQMLFDPYDWKDMANRIEWALENRAALLARQRPFYDRLAQRTWRQVVDDHIEILDRIAAQGCSVAAKT
jgi:glycosyltransferase involved in cell wall biosynthesis